MIQREVIINKLVEFYTGKVDELANQKCSYNDFPTLY